MNRMSFKNIMIFIGILVLGFVLVILLGKSRKKKGPLVSGEDVLNVNSRDFDDGL